MCIRDSYDPDWVIHIDGDEILDKPHDVRYNLSVSGPRIASYSLRVRYLWDSREQERVDGIYGKFRRGSIFRLAGQPRTAQFRATGAGGNFHCGNVPAGLVGIDQPMDASLMHLGYLYQDDRLRKFSWYNEQDPGNVFEDCYRHMVQGLSLIHISEPTRLLSISY